MSWNNITPAYLLDETEAERIGSYLRGRRIDLGLTQSKLSKIVKCSPSSISRLESGTASMKLDRFFKILSALKLKPRFVERK